MANVISQVKLPNNTTYTIRDPNARPLTNNDFDTINVTELNAGDLIVTGVGRFTNGLYGNLIGNADTATSAIKATQDESGNNIKSTYANAISINDHTITLKNKNGTSLGTVTVPDNNTTYTVGTGTANGKIKVTPSTGNAYEVSVYGLKSAAYKDVTDTYSETGTDPVSGKAVKAAIDGLPSPMVFRGTVGAAAQNPTVTSLPVDGTAVVGDTYKVITNGTYGGKASKVGDTLICLTKTSSANTWEIVPSGDEPSGTVTSVAISNGGGLSVSGSPITSSGTITISHADTSSQASVNNSGRTYIQDITLDTYGHVTGITSATETVVNTDRYVNSAAFADATSADANNPVKMTLTRAGSDTASVTAYIPKVSSSSAGVVPKGAAVSSQSKTTKFLREDGTWAAPSYTTNTNTTYSLSASGESVVLTGSDSSTSTADLSSAFANYTPYKGNLTSAIGGNTAAANTKTYWENNTNIPTQSVSTAYNTNGTEYSLLFSKGGSANYGSILRWGYSSNYIEMLRKYGSTWKTDDWEKISAGYADTAGSATSATSATRATQDSDGNAINTTYVKKNNGNKAYTALASYYMGGTASTYVRILVPSIATIWTMLYMELSVRRDYTSSQGGKLIINGYHSSTSPYSWTSFNATHLGRVSGLEVFASDGQYIYIKGLGAYSTISVDKMLFGDNAVQYDHTAVTIDTVSELPETYQTATMYSSYGTYNKPAWGDITGKPTTISGYGIIDAKIASGVITLGSNTITPLTAASTLDATKLSGTIPSSCYTDTKNTAGSTDTSSKIFLVGATSQTSSSQTYSQDTAYVGTDGCVYSGGNKVEVVSNNAGYHNSVYRGKSLGTSITEAQWASISAGTFEDMYIGDYWTLSTTLGSTTSNVQYVIAGFDYWWNCGDSYPQSSNKHHVVLVPASYLYAAQMNETNITTGGYIGSAMYTTNLANARTGISNLFGDHLYSVRRLFTNSVNASGQATSWAWTTSSVDLMNENMVYGSSVWTTSGFEVGVDRTILPLFALNPASASIRAYWWLRSVATPAAFSIVSGDGGASCGSASGSLGVRPAFAIY